MDDQFWSNCANNADSHYNEEFAKFIRNLTVSLKCNSVLEVGCNAGNDLTLFSKETKVFGLDYNDTIIEKARARNPSFDFTVGSSQKMPYEDTSMDIVFTHGFFNYLQDDLIDKSVSEIFRVAKAYIVTCEIAGNMIDKKDDRKSRDMLKRWSSYPLRVISNVEMHEDIDAEKPVFFLAKKTLA